MVAIRSAAAAALGDHQYSYVLKYAYERIIIGYVGDKTLCYCETGADIETYS